jgi:Xaa-Pro aminopeptidase
MVLAVLCAWTPGSAQEISVGEYQQRRNWMFDAVSDGILLVHSRTLEKAMEQPGFVQDANFYYFTGAPNLPGAILALDGVRRESRVFVPPPPRSFGMEVSNVTLPPGGESARRLGVSAVQPRSEFVEYVEDRLAADVRVLYVDDSRHPEPTGVPGGMRPIAGDKTLWRLSVSETFRDVEVRSVQPAIRALRWVKSPGEIDRLRRNARATASALIGGARTVRPGLTQREAEAAVVHACILAGAQGPSFWPWMMSGPNGHVDQLVRAFYDYDHLDRAMQAGELVRVDIGCGGASYGGDVGRTIPVSGFFDAGQRETWNLLIDAYRVGVSVMRAGVAISDVMAASRARIAELAPSLQTGEAREAAASLVTEDGMALWSIHGVGIESGETGLDVLEAGSVIAFEPMFSRGPDAFYLEDMIAITETGHEILSAGLPYTAEEIEAVMRSR